MLWLVIFLVVAISYRIWQVNHSHFWKNFYAIPGPKPLPVVGNLFQLLSYDSAVMFKKREQRGKKYYPLYKCQALGRIFVAVNCPEDMELVLTNMKHITKNKNYDFLQNWLGTGLLTSTGAKWQQRRKLLTPSFHFSILQEFLNTFNAESQSLVKMLKKQCDKPYINVINPITEFTLISIGETSMGINLSSLELSGSLEKSNEYKRAVYNIGDIITKRTARPWLFIPAIYKMTELHKIEQGVIKVLHTFTNNVIKERKNNFVAPKNGEEASYSVKKRLAMLDLLLNFKAQGADISDEGIREEVDTFLFEGHDTTSMGICFALLILANHPKVQDLILEEIDSLVEEGATPTFKEYQQMNYLERCIKESLRLYPSVPYIGRVAGEDIKTSTGYTIPKGCDINLYIYDLHHNQNVFEDPEKFDPDRFLPFNCKNRHPFAYLPFSAGARNCIGQKFAILEMKAAITHVLRNFKLEAVDTLKDIKLITDIVLRPQGEIRIKFVPRT